MVQVKRSARQFPITEYLVSFYNRDAWGGVKKGGGGGKEPCGAP